MNKKFNKQLLLPIITAIILLVKYTTGYEIPEAAVDLAADLIMGAITLWGMFVHPHVTETPQTGGQTDANQEYKGSSDSAV